MSETTTIIDELHNVLTRDRLKKDAEYYLEICRILYPGKKHGGWESIVLSTVLIDLAKKLEDCHLLFSLKSVPIIEMEDTEMRIAETYEKILKAHIVKKMATEIDGFVVWRNQQCLIEHETHWKDLSLPIMQVYRIADLINQDANTSLSCVFITHTPIRKPEDESNPITKFIAYAQACETLFGRSRWAIVNIWEKKFDWRLEKIDVWWIPQDFSISILEEKEKESQIPGFWRNLGRH